MLNKVGLCRRRAERVSDDLRDLVPAVAGQAGVPASLAQDSQVGLVAHWVLFLQQETLQVDHPRYMTMDLLGGNSVTLCSDYNYRYNSSHL